MDIDFGPPIPRVQEHVETKPFLLLNEETGEVIRIWVYDIRHDSMGSWGEVKFWFTDDIKKRDFLRQQVDNFLKGK